MSKKLSNKMSVESFDNGYWFAVEIKAFAKEIGIKPVSKHRKDELEDLIRHFLKTGIIKNAERNTNSPEAKKDIELGLRLSLPVINYSDVKETKDFLRSEALKIEPELKRKSGSQYRLNRWREEMQAAGNLINYKDLIEKFVELNNVNGPFPQAPSGRYINFLSDFMKNETDASRADALEAWHELKKLNIPKNYTAWKSR